MNNEKRLEYYKRLLERVEEEIKKSDTDYDYLQIMFEAKNSLVFRITELDNIQK